MSRGSGRTSSTRASATRLIPAAASHGHGQRVRRELLVGEQRPEHGGPEQRAEDRAEEHVGDPAGAALGRVEVACRRPDQQGDPACGAREREAEDHERRRAEVGRERRERAARGSRGESAGDDRPPPDPVHRPPGRHRRQRRGGEEDRRPQAEQPFHPRHEHEGQRRDRGDELQHRREDRHDRREQERVAADREIVGVHGRRNSPTRRRPIASRKERGRPGRASGAALRSPQVNSGQTKPPSAARLEPATGVDAHRSFLRTLGAVTDFMRADAFAPPPRSRSTSTPRAMSNRYT